MSILVTGSAGFIGAAIVKRLLLEGHNVIGLDNYNNYYDTNLKKDRIKNIRKLKNSKNFNQVKGNITNINLIRKLFEKYQIEYVVHLAAQAGVRYSMENPLEYVNSNILGFTNLLEFSRKNKVKHFIYASSSSVYGLNTKLPYSISDTTDHPVSVYAATKKSNELIAHSYSHLYDIAVTGLRFFTVYGPWDRPDMAMQLFSEAIIKNKKINLFNYGNHTRDFTYIDDVVEAVNVLIFKPSSKNKNWNSKSPKLGSSSAKFKVYNVGSSKRVKLKYLVSLLEKYFNKKAKINLLPLQPGDVIDTYANVLPIKKNYNFSPGTNIERGVEKFVIWYKKYYT